MVDQYSLSDAGIRYVVSHGGDAASNIHSLDARKLHGLSAPARFSIGVGTRAVCSLTGPYITVVDGTAAHLHKDPLQARARAEVRPSLTTSLSGPPCPVK